MTTQQEPIPAAHLEQAMIENTRSDTSESRIKVYQELIFSDLLLALSDTAPEEQKPQTDEPPQSLNIAILENPQGLKFAAVFTSTDTIRRWRPQGGQYATMKGQDIFKLLEPSPAEVIVVNPGSAPLIVLKKAEYRQLAAGIVPKTTQSPVQTPVSHGNAPSEEPPQNSVQISFPTNVFTEAQKNRTYDVLFKNFNVGAAAIGAILPPNSPNKDNWVRTIFLRVQNMEEENNETLKSLCHDLKNEITDKTDIFQQTQFEVGVMPDPKFWESLHQNNVVLFDKSFSSQGQNATTH